MDVRILATDISSHILTRAQQGVYTHKDVQEMSERFVQKYFKRQQHAVGDVYQISDLVRQLISFARLNLMQPWPMKGQFDVILCRNVMIYFDTKTRQRLVERFYDYLKPGGYLMIGHSESLTGISGNFHYVQPAIYMR